MGAGDPVLNQSLKIAMDYMQLTGQAQNYEMAQRRAASSILTAVRLGMAVENDQAGQELQSFYPRVS